HPGRPSAALDLERPTVGGPRLDVEPVARKLGKAVIAGHPRGKLGADGASSRVAGEPPFDAEFEVGGVDDDVIVGASDRLIGRAHTDRLSSSVAPSRSQPRSISALAAFRAGPSKPSANPL